MGRKNGNGKNNRNCYRKLIDILEAQTNSKKINPIAPLKDKKGYYFALCHYSEHLGIIGREKIKEKGYLEEGGCSYLKKFHED